MKYFLDTEFMEGFHKPLFGKRRHYIDLISIGIVREDGKSFYRISSDYNPKNANSFVREYVLSAAFQNAVHGDERNHYSLNNFHHYFGWPEKQIRDKLLDFFGCYYDSDAQKYYSPEPVTIYGYYADYDWVLFCSLFGTMMELPGNFPMFCVDLKQELNELVTSLTKDGFITAYPDLLKKVKGLPGYPQPKKEHHALEDARWNLELYKFLQKKKTA